MNRLWTMGKDLARARLRHRAGELPVAMAGMTLEADDAALAQDWLRRRRDWSDPAPVARFESSFAQWNGSRFAFAFSGGRKALSACLHALRLGPGDEVIVPGYTCIVVQNAFDHAGIRTAHCDIELETFGPDLDSVAARITPRTRAVLVQHLYGLVCRDYGRILDLARRTGLRVIEDCAHATGARFRGRRLGTLGDAAFYSAEVSKVFTCILGGVAVTDDPQIAAGLRDYAAQFPPDSVVDRQLRTAILTYARLRGSSRWWRLPVARFRHGAAETVAMPGTEVAGHLPADYRTRMAPAAAALALNQLPKIDRFNDRRRRVAARWDAWCDQTGRTRPLVIEDSEPVFLRYPLLVEPERKADTGWAQRELGVPAGVWFRTHLHPSPRLVAGCPNADRAVAQCVNFPCLLA